MGTMPCFMFFRLSLKKTSKVHVQGQFLAPSCLDMISFSWIRPQIIFSKPILQKNGEERNCNPHPFGRKKIIIHLEKDQTTKQQDMKRANSSRDKNSHTPFADTRSGVVNVCIDRRDLIEHTNTRTLRQFHEGNIT